VNRESGRLNDTVKNLIRVSMQKVLQRNGGRREWKCKINPKNLIKGKRQLLKEQIHRIYFIYFFAKIF
jgi:hypothetical protein